MTAFIDGPAVGQTLFLKRAPLLLRVVRSSRGWDALDQPTDAPQKDERVFVYVRATDVRQMHVRRSGGGGFFAGADYRFLPEQPDDAIIRDAARWQAWTEATGPLLLRARDAEAFGLDDITER